MNMDLAIRYKARVAKVAAHQSTEAADIHEDLEALCPPDVPDRKKRLEKMLAKVLMKIMDQKSKSQ